MINNIDIQAPDGVKPLTRRRRGNHSVACLNPNPKHVRKRAYKKLPGAMGTLARISAKKRIHSSLVILESFKLMNRKRDFRDVSKKLIDQLWRAIFDCLDMATLMPTKCFEQIALELDVTPSRVSRLLKGMFVPAGLIQPYDTDEYKPQYNSTHGVCFPSMVFVTDKFFEAGGANEKLVARLHQLHQEKLAEILDIQSGQPMRLNAARALRKKWAWDRAYERRKNAARAQKKRTYLAGLTTVDERLHYVGKQLLLANGDLYLHSPRQLHIDAWSILHRLGVSESGKKEKRPPH